MGGFRTKCRFGFSKALLSTTQPPHQKSLREYREKFPIANHLRHAGDVTGDEIVDLQNVAENVGGETQRGGNIAQDSIHSER